MAAKYKRGKDVPMYAGQRGTANIVPDKVNFIQAVLLVLVIPSSGDARIWDKPAHDDYFKGGAVAVYGQGQLTIYDLWVHKSRSIADVMTQIASFPLKPVAFELWV